MQSRLDALWKQLAARGLSVILEDGTWKRSERDALRRVASSLGATTVLHYFDIGLDELWRRLELRNADKPYGAAPITKDVLIDCWSSRLERPDPAELALFDHHVVHTTLSAAAMLVPAPDDARRHRSSDPARRPHDPAPPRPRRRRRPAGVLRRRPADPGPVADADARERRGRPRRRPARPTCRWSSCSTSCPRARRSSPWAATAGRCTPRSSGACSRRGSGRPRTRAASSPGPTWPPGWPSVTSTPSRSSAT